ncbi:unnamed protein product [Amoebophrya sp. A120]|nr:unnamed protein product [Amoebophrya sp. A120]|eukprot:GSA120T00021186001.1
MTAHHCKSINFGRLCVAGLLCVQTLFQHVGLFEDQYCFGSFVSALQPPRHRRGNNINRSPPRARGASSSAIVNPPDNPSAAPPAATAAPVVASTTAPAAADGQEQEDNCCPICGESNIAEVKLTPCCAKRFCDSCWNEWRRRTEPGKQLRCPFCRNEDMNGITLKELEDTRAWAAMHAQPPACGALINSNDIRHITQPSLRCAIEAGCRDAIAKQFRRSARVRENVCVLLVGVAALAFGSEYCIIAFPAACASAIAMSQASFWRDKGTEFSHFASRCWDEAKQGVVTVAAQHREPATGPRPTEGAPRSSRGTPISLPQSLL